MELKRIKTDLCPHCGSEPISEEKLSFNPFNRKEFVEIRSFECGLKLMSIPDGDTVVDKRCPNSKESGQITKNRVKALSRLFRFVDELEVDDNFKCSIRTALTYELITE